MKHKEDPLIGDFLARLDDPKQTPKRLLEPARRKLRDLRKYRHWEPNEKKRVQIGRAIEIVEPHTRSPKSR